MTAGLSDYDDDEIYKWTLMNPDGNISPIYYLKNLAKSSKYKLNCKPGNCWSYSTDSYLLLGLALC